jgi:Arc/MetJ family transcription regulator
MGRTNIVLDDELISKVMALSGTTSKREAVRISLEAFVKRNARQNILRHRAPGTWQDDLATLRQDTCR